MLTAPISIKLHSFNSFVLTLLQFYYIFHIIIHFVQTNKLRHYYCESCGYLTPTCFLAFSKISAILSESECGIMSLWVLPTANNVSNKNIHKNNIHLYKQTKIKCVFGARICLPWIKQFRISWHWYANPTVFQKCNGFPATGSGNSKTSPVFKTSSFVVDQNGACIWQQSNYFKIYLNPLIR